jgi:hypothetical protein
LLLSPSQANCLASSSNPLLEVPMSELQSFFAFGSAAIFSVALMATVLRYFPQLISQS